MAPINVPNHPARTAPEEKFSTRVLRSFPPDIAKRTAGTITTTKPGRFVKLASDPPSMIAQRNMPNNIATDVYALTTVLTS